MLSEGEHGRKLAFGTKTVVGGWSISRRAPRHLFECAEIGSVFVYEVEGDWLEGLAEACLIGLDELACIGLNFAIPLCSREVERGA